APSSCSNGIPGVQNNQYCCKEECGSCGGVGCGTIPGTGGSSSCCPSTIELSGKICGDAPCIIEGYTPTPAPKIPETAAPVG
ncbi:unnamed protein product, partial [Discosporangium mesarthrocarpum]